jgi:hypothetical protein
LPQFPSLGKPLQGGRLVFAQKRSVCQKQEKYPSTPKKQRSEHQENYEYQVHCGSLTQGEKILSLGRFARAIVFA